MVALKITNNINVLIKVRAVVHARTSPAAVTPTLTLPVSDSGSVPQPALLQEHGHVVVETGAEGRGAGVSLSPPPAGPDSSVLTPSSACRAKRASTEVMDPGAAVKKPVPAQPRRDARQIYNPPSGKYSATIGNFSYGE